jgi:hypothetical protein
VTWPPKKFLDPSLHDCENYSRCHAMERLRYFRFRVVILTTQKILPSVARNVLEAPSRCRD